MFSLFICLIPAVRVAHGYHGSQHAVPGVRSRVLHDIQLPIRAVRPVLSCAPAPFTVPSGGSVAPFRPTPEPPKTRRAGSARPLSAKQTQIAVGGIDIGVRQREEQIRALEADAVFAYQTRPHGLVQSGICVGFRLVCRRGRAHCRHRQFITAGMGVNPSDGVQ